MKDCRDPHLWEIGDSKISRRPRLKISLQSPLSRRVAPRKGDWRLIFNRGLRDDFAVSDFPEVRMSITTRYNHNSIFNFLYFFLLWLIDFHTLTFSRFFKTLIFSRQRWELTSPHLWRVLNVRTGQSSPLAWLETAKSLILNLLINFSIPSSNA